MNIVVWWLSFKYAFPELYGITRLRNASIADLMRCSDGILSCALSFTWSVEDWELKSLSIFMDLLYSNPVRGSGVDKI